MKTFYRLADVLRQWFTIPCFGFVQGRAYLSPHEVGQIRKHIAKPAKEIASEFEDGFASIVGEGRAVCRWPDGLLRFDENLGHRAG